MQDVPLNEGTEMPSLLNSTAGVANMNDTTVAMQSIVNNNNNNNHISKENEKECQEMSGVGCTIYHKYNYGLRMLSQTFDENGILLHFMGKYIPIKTVIKDEFEQTLENNASDAYWFSFFDFIVFIFVMVVPSVITGLNKCIFIHPIYVYYIHIQYFLIENKTKKNKLFLLTLQKNCEFA